MRVTMYVIAGLAVLLLAALVFAPREPVDLTDRFDPSVIGDDLDAYLATREARFDDITPGTEARIVWAGAPGRPTPEVVVYIHGFSATSEEIRPVPDLVAQGRGANLLFWRLAGHGRGGDAMAEPKVADWIQDMAEALAVAERMGDTVTVIATSTGGTLAALAATIPELAPKIDRLVMVSPNFRLVNPAARILTWPGVRLWGPLIAGDERAFETRNADHGRYWTTRYPTVATLPMAASVSAARAADYGSVDVPALFLFSEDDRVVAAEATRAIAARWGGPATVSPQVLAETDDPYDHVIAGDILSPTRSASVADEILGWLAGL